MKELLYTILELEEWHKDIDNLPCEFCTIRFGNKNKVICQIRTRSKETHKIVENDFACQECKEKFENNQIPKCDKCGRLRTKSDTEVITGKYVCRCIKWKEDTLEKELPVLPHEERESTFYEIQINDLRGKLNTAEETIEVEREVHEDFMKTSEVWSKRQKQELLDRIRELEEENKKLSSEELAQKVETYEKEIAELRKQLERLKEQNQQTAQIEVKSSKKFSFSPFNRKS